MGKNSNNNETSWLERHAWAIATCLVIFLFKMCSDLSRH